jgi:hypothetical protein
MEAWQGSPREHPDADLLTAFAEGNVSPRERTSVLSHLTECPSCRNILALRSTSIVEPVVHSRAATSKPIQGGWWIAAVAAIICIVLAATWKISRPDRSLKVTELSKAENIAVPKPEVPVLESTSPKTAAPRKTAMRKKKSDLLAQNSAAHQSTGRSGVAEHSAVSESDDASRQANTSTNAEAKSEQSIAPSQVQAVVPNQMFSSAPAPAERAFSAARRAAPKVFLPVPAPLMSNRQTVWSLDALSSEGTIRKSEDGGRTWQTVPVDGPTPIYAVSATGPIVWAGGGDGKLFRSDDGGISWRPVQVIYQGGVINDRILAIDARGASVKVKTASGLTFVTSDGGARWERQ